MQNALLIAHTLKYLLKCGLSDETASVDVHRLVPFCYAVEILCSSQKCTVHILSPSAFDQAAEHQLPVLDTPHRGGAVLALQRSATMRTHDGTHISIVLLYHRKNIAEVTTAPKIKQVPLLQPRSVAHVRNWIQKIYSSIAEYLRNSTAT